MIFTVKNVTIFLLLIALIILLVLWLFGKKDPVHERFTEATISTQNTDNGIFATNSGSLTLDEEILLMNSILTTIHQNFMQVSDCSNNNSDCIKEGDKDNIYNAYKTSQLQPIEDRLKIFETLTDSYKNKYGDLSNIYWDFKLLDLKSDVTMDEYYYTIVKNIAINKIYEYIQSNMGIIPVEIKKKYPLEIPRNVIQNIVDKYFKLDVNDSTINFIGIQNALEQNSLANKPVSGNASLNNTAPLYTGTVGSESVIPTTVDMILQEPNKYIYSKKPTIISESEEIILKSRGPLIQSEYKY